MNRARAARWFLIACLAFCATGVSGASNGRAEFLVLFATPASTAGDGALRTAVENFLRAFPAHASRLREGLPRALRARARFEPLAALDACLVTVPTADGARTGTALRAQIGAAHSAVLYVAAHGEVAAGTDAPRPPAPPPPGLQLPWRRLTLALVDLGADGSHPWFADVVGRLHYQPGTPGEDGSARLLRSHGTAMLGLYAQLLRGEALTAGGVVQPWLRLPYLPVVSDTLIAHAGPETRAGRGDLARALNWLMMPDAEHPLPALINYSQGNGRLCEPRRSARCVRWAGVTRVIDRLVDERGVVIVKSAGNHGDGPDDTMTVPGESYNAIVVGNMHAFDWSRCAPGAERSTHKIYRTSSVAPAAGGRRLLHVVAPGVRMTTAGVNPAWCERQCRAGSAIPCAFCPRLGRADAQGAFIKRNSGTSPAAAVVGALALSLMDRGVRDPRLVKALLINSADGWQSKGAPHPTVYGDGRGCTTDTHARRHGPLLLGAQYDRSYGYGYVNPARLAAERPYARLDVVHAAGARCYASHLQAGDKLTLVWHRHVGQCSGCGRHGWYRLNRLRLGLYAAQDGSLIAGDASVSGLDNVLQVALDATPRAVVVRVDTAQQRFDGPTPDTETFALASARALRPLLECPPLREVVAP